MDLLVVGALVWGIVAGIIGSKKLSVDLRGVSPAHSECLPIEEGGKRLQSIQGRLIIALFGCGILLGAGCSRERQIEGQIFVVTKGRENIKMGLVGVHVVSSELMKPIAAELSAKYQKAQADQNLKFAQATSNAEALAQFDKDLVGLVSSELGLPEIVEIRRESASRQSEFHEASFEVTEPLLKSGGLAEALFERLPKFKTQSDADGKFTVKAMPGDCLLARSERIVGSGEEKYVWVLRIQEDQKAVLLSNDCMLDDTFGLPIFLHSSASIVDEKLSTPKPVPDEKTLEWIGASTRAAKLAYSNKMDADKKAREQARIEAERIAAEEKVKQERVVAAEKAEKARQEIAATEAKAKLEMAAIEARARHERATLDAQEMRVNTLGKALIFGGMQADAVQRGLKLGGKVVSWGGNGKGVTAPPAGLTGIVQVAVTDNFFVALKSDGTVLTWGSVPSDFQQIPADLDGVVSIAASYDYILALRCDGTVVVWGSKYTSRGVKNVPKALNDVVAIAAGAYHCLALKKDGTVVAWGYDANNQCDVPQGLHDIIAIAAGNRHSVALRTDGTVFSWGDDSVCSRQPQDLKTVVSIAAGASVTIAVLRDGSVVSWGPFSEGSNYSSHESVKKAVGPVSIGKEACACLMANGDFWRWGKKEVVKYTIPSLLTEPGNGLLSVVAGDDCFVAIVLEGSATVSRQGSTDLQNSVKPSPPIFAGDVSIYAPKMIGCGHGFGFWVNPGFKGMRICIYLNGNKPTTFTVGKPDAILDVDTQKTGSAQYISEGHTFNIEWDNSKFFSTHVPVTVWIVN